MEKKARNCPFGRGQKSVSDSGGENDVDDECSGRLAFYFQEESAKLTDFQIQIRIQNHNQFSIHINHARNLVIVSIYEIIVQYTARRSCYVQFGICKLFSNLWSEMADKHNA